MYSQVDQKLKPALGRGFSFLNVILGVKVVLPQQYNDSNTVRARANYSMVEIKFEISRSKSDKRN